MFKTEWKLEGQAFGRKKRNKPLTSNVLLTLLGFPRNDIAAMRQPVPGDPGGVSDTAWSWLGTVAAWLCSEGGTTRSCDSTSPRHTRWVVERRESFPLLSMATAAGFGLFVTVNLNFAMGCQDNLRTAQRTCLPAESPW